MHTGQNSFGCLETAESPSTLHVLISARLAHYHICILASIIPSTTSQDSGGSPIFSLDPHSSTASHTSSHTSSHTLTKCAWRHRNVWDQGACRNLRHQRKTRWDMIGSLISQNGTWEWVVNITAHLISAVSLYPQHIFKEEMVCDCNWLFSHHTLFAPCLAHWKDSRRWCRCLVVTQ